MAEAGGFGQNFESSRIIQSNPLLQYLLYGRERAFQTDQVDAGSLRLTKLGIGFGQSVRDGVSNRVLERRVKLAISRPTRNKLRILSVFLQEFRRSKNVVVKLG